MNFLKWKIFLRFGNVLEKTHFFFHLNVFVTKMVKEKEPVNLRGVRGNMSLGELEKKDRKEEGYNYNLIKNNPQLLDW